MKKGFIIILALWIQQLSAQTGMAPGISKDNPFADIGIDEPVLGLNGFAEMPTDSLVVIAGWVYNKRTGTLVSKLAPDSNDTLAQLFGNQQLYRWLSVDPVVHPYQSPYTSFDNNPIVYVDPDGRKIEWSFASSQGMTGFLAMVNKGLEGEFEVKLKPINKDGVYYEVQLVAVQGKGNYNNLSGEAKVYYDVFNEAINDKATVIQDIVEKDPNTWFGSFMNNRVDVEDLMHLREGLGTGHMTRQSVIIHEVYEQLIKARMGIAKGDFADGATDAEKMKNFEEIYHRPALSKEGLVGGYERTYDADWGQTGGAAKETDLYYIGGGELRQLTITTDVNTQEVQKASYYE